MNEWSTLRPFLPPHSKIRMSSIAFLSFVGGLFESAVLVIVALTADTLIRGEDALNIGPVQVSQMQAILLALVLVVGRIVMNLSGSMISARFTAKVMFNAQRAALRGYVDSSHSTRSSRAIGDLAAVAVSHGQITGELGYAYTAVAAAVCSLLSFGSMSLVVNPLATLGIATIGGVLFVLVKPLRKKSRQAARAFAASTRALSTEVTELETLHREVEVFRVGDRVIATFDDELSEVARRQERLRFLSGITPPVFQAALLGAAVLSLIAIVNRAADTNLAAVGAVVLLLIRSMSAAQALVITNQTVIERGSYARSLDSLIKTLRAGERQFGTERPTVLTPISLKDVTFSYGSNVDVLNGLTLEFNVGELVGVVGPSGAGKSTLVELILRLRPVSSGSITYGGIDSEQIDPDEFGRRVAFVPQQARLIKGTVAENIRFYRDIPDEKIRKALRDAHLEEDIEALPDGLSTRLGPDDRSLSGGQQQRLTIARALAGDPDILILDEPTSALDAVSENAVRRTLAELPSGRVVIIVAHRYSTLSSCSRILVLDNGNVAADASPDEVAKRSEFFKAMIGESS